MSEAKILGIANQKGGVGKTTTALTLAAALAARGKKVLVLDLDPHCCASVHLRYYPDSSKPSVYDLFTTDPDTWADVWKKIIHRPESVDFDIVPASIHLSDLETELKNRRGKGNILAHALKLQVENYDYILMDCPPHLGILLVNALIASNLVVVPIQTDFLAVHGLKLLVDTIKMLNKALPEPLDYRALPTMYDKRTRACAKVLELLHNKMSGRVFQSVIGMDTKFREASAQGTVIQAIDKNSRGAQAYDSLAEEILKLW